MPKERLLAFTDGVIAIIITIMVLDLKIPGEPTLAALWGEAPVFLSYVLSFAYVAIYWNNHHHFYHAIARIDAATMWANMGFLFVLSLVPFATAWMGETHFAPVPTATYGVALMLAALGWYVMQWAMLRSAGCDSALARAIGRDLKGKLSPMLYVFGIAAAFWDTRISDAVYALVALFWLVPDRRIERALRMQATVSPER